MKSGGAGQASLGDLLKKILLLEKQRGFNNTAVVGGLDRFLARVAAENQALFQRLQNLGLLSNYSAMTVEERRAWVEGVLEAATGPQSSKLLEAPKPSVPRQEPSRKAPWPVSLDSPVTTLRGVSARLASKLHRLGVYTIRDLLYFFPRRHNDFARVVKIANLEVGQEQTVVATVWEASEVVLGKGMKATEAVVGDETGNVRAVWFNQPFVARVLKPNSQVVLSGRVGLFRGQKVFEVPEYEVLDGQEELIHTGRLVPVYPLTEGLSPKYLRRLIKENLDLWLPHLEDYLPPAIRERVGLMGLAQAIAQAHFPDDPLAKAGARRRLAFDELFLMQLWILGRKREWQQGEGYAIPVVPRLLQAFLDSLPFSLTSSQHRALREILSAMETASPMSRLLQGDVGSGKTVVATAALLMTVVNGYQGAIMAPTEILAQQHFRTVKGILQQLARPLEEDREFAVYLDPFPRPISVGLLLGSMRKREKEEMQRRIAQGAVDIIIGTHALIQEEVEIPRLALAVVDEQHRFGVMQRASLRHKGRRPHLLVMSATPIPRTLALTLYGDLDLSIIEELPPGRPQVKTRWLMPHQRQAAYDFLRREVSRGRQAFVICPLIEESEALETRAVLEEYHRLSQEVFPDLRVGLLHGRLPPKEKERVMERFCKGEVDILVSTPVVEVGIDVPNATVMLIEGAERFGLAQLHQLRGRVRRGEHQGYCLLLADSPSPEARERLAILERVSDGFALAEEDLRVRGPGDFLGTRQSGLPNLRMARLSDADLFSLARREASALMEKDAHLRLPEHRALAQELERYCKTAAGDLS